MSAINKDAEAALEQAAIEVFESLKWDHIYAEYEIDGDPTLLGRGHQGEIVLTRYLEPALKKLNPTLPSEAITEAIDILTHDRSTMSIAAANRDVYQLLKNGIRVTCLDSKGDESVERVKVIDWDNPKENDFLLVSQLWVNGDPYKRRPDLVGFINGLPMVFIELKAPDKPIQNAYKDNLTDYKSTIPFILWYNAITILSNGSQTKMGSVSATWEHFSDWKKINNEGEHGIISLDTLIKGICEKTRFIDILENFTYFSEEKGGVIKLVAKNHQYHGVNNAMCAVDQIKENQGRLGVFWHTQGSGKSASMVFFTQKVLRKIEGNWTFVIVTDRIELDGQIYKTFARAGIIKQKEVHAESSKELRNLLTEDHRYVFTLIHKFRTENGKRHSVLSDRDNIIVVTDEAHRSQYDVFAQNMRDALPNAAFIGFTGTPLIKTEEEKTREVFGDYVSIYNFRQSNEDKATVPLYYENRIPEVQLTNENLNEDMEQLLDDAMLDEDQEKKLEREFAKQYHIITRDDRLEKIAEDIVSHFMGRGHLGKAMVVSVDKATAVKMYDKVQVYWKKYLNDLKSQTAIKQDEELEEIQKKIVFMEGTDMTVVVSQGQNEVEEMKKKGADILPHRKRMVKEDLDEKFKDPKDPLRILFVCAMWMTGFDVPSCSTIYLDKPMKNHTLMQTIARANRVFPDKENGLIVDYVGVFRNLERALAIYAAADGITDTPIKNKDEIKSQLQIIIAKTVDFLRGCEVDLNKILQTEDVLERTKLKDDAVDAILVSEDSKKQYLQLADRVKIIHKAYLPDPLEQEVSETVYIIKKLADQIRSLTPPVDISDVMNKVENLLDESIEGYALQDPSEPWKIFDLSKIDFDALREKFEKGRRRIEVERLKGMIENKLQMMVNANKTRINFLERFQEMIDEYNSGAKNIEELFDKLIQFAQDLNEEEKRFIREGLNSEEELTIFDLLTKPEMKITKKEEKDVKKISRTLLNKLKTEKFVLDWTKKQQARAAVQLTISDVLDELPEVYTKELYNNKCNLIYQYVYDRYYSKKQPSV